MRKKIYAVLRCISTEPTVHEIVSTHFTRHEAEEAKFLEDSLCWTAKFKFEFPLGTQFILK